MKGFTHDIYPQLFLSHSCTLKKSLRYFILTVLCVLEEDIYARRNSNSLENNCSGLNFSTGWEEFAKTVPAPQPESIGHPNQILRCHGRRGSTQRGCKHYETIVVTRLSSQSNVKYSALLPTPQRSSPLLRPGPRSQKFTATMEGIVGSL